jgi:hypothetical protein
MEIITKRKDIQLTRFIEAIQPAAQKEYKELLNQMEQNPDLVLTLNTRVKDNPKYKFLTDDWMLGNATLLMIIDGSLKTPAMKSFFVKNSKNAFIGFIAINLVSEDNSIVVNNIKIFSFGLNGETDENQMFKDLPSFLNGLIQKYKKVSWIAIEGNKANRAYAIITKRYGGTIKKLGTHIRYTVQR